MEGTLAGKEQVGDAEAEEVAVAELVTVELLDTKEVVPCEDVDALLVIVEDVLVED